MNFNTVYRLIRDILTNLVYNGKRIYYYKKCRIYTKNGMQSTYFRHLIRERGEKIEEKNTKTYCHADCAGNGFISISYGFWDEHYGF